VVQHHGAARAAHELGRALDHAVTLTLGRGSHLAGPCHLEALFGAALGLQLGHFALLFWTAGVVRWPDRVLRLIAFESVKSRHGMPRRATSSDLLRPTRPACNAFPPSSCPEGRPKEPGIRSGN